MGFLSRIGLVETAEQEQARLAASPEGSINHSLSLLPVRIQEYPKDLLIKLPWSNVDAGERYVIVVVPVRYTPDARPTSIDMTPARPAHRHPGSWECAVVASDHPWYPVGGHRVSISGAELARGERIDLAVLLGTPGANAEA